MWIEKAEMPTCQSDQSERVSLLPLFRRQKILYNQHEKQLCPLSVKPPYMFWLIENILFHTITFYILFFIFCSLYICFFFSIYFLFFFSSHISYKLDFHSSTSKSFHWTRNNFSLHQKINPKPKCPCFDKNCPILSRLFQIQRNFKAIIENKSCASDTKVWAGFELLPYWVEHIIMFSKYPQPLQIYVSFFLNP